MAQPPPTPVWLYPGKTASSVTSATIELLGDRVQLRIREKTGKRKAEQIAKLAEDPSLAARLTRENGVIVLDRPAAEIESKPAGGGFGARLNLRVDGSRWRIDFYQIPMVAAGPLALIALPMMVKAMLGGRRAAAPWREALETWGGPDEEDR